MTTNVQHESDRASRISFMTTGYHESVSSIYERLVDREYYAAKKDVKSLMKELRELLKLIDEDDF